VTCNFWHWELEYVLYLCNQNVLRGDAAVEAHLWDEERREELEQALGKKKLAEEWGKGTSCKIAADDNLLSRDVGELLVLGRQIVLLFKVGVAMLCFFVVLCVWFILKK
jgi:hypothetical protein